MTTLADLTDAEVYARFDALQGRLPDVWRAMQHDRPDESVVVVPSVSLDKVTAGSAATNQAMEERYLFLLLLLRQPRLRMVYVTSMPIEPAIIEYYLALLPGVIPSHVRRRLTLLAVRDSEPRPLTSKLLERPALLARIREAIPDPAWSHLVPYTTTTLERDLAVQLGIPMYGADPRLVSLGTKTGCRRLFADEGIGYPLGAEDLHGVDDVAAALDTMLGRRPIMAEAIVKLNEGVSGSGNALVDLRGLPAPGDRERPAALRDRVSHMALESPTVPFDGYLAKLASHGGVVEERIVGADFRSPSVQLRVTPLGEVELLSTHDQLLGGPSGQAYLGCKFPADPAYAAQISAQARVAGERLARDGVLGRFALDFVAVRDGDSWRTYAIELNLRKGGTTHPFLTMAFLTGGGYDEHTSLFTTPTGDEKHLVATDHLESPQLRGLTVDDLFDIVARRGLHFDQARQVGIVFHMISCLTELGRLGMTAVGNSRADAEAVYQRAEQVLLEEAAQAGAPLPLPG